MVSIPTSRKGMVSPVLAVSLGIVTVACVAAVYLMNAQYQQQNADLQKRLDTAVAELKALQTATPAATATPQATATASASPTASASDEVTFSYKYLMFDQKTKTSSYRTSDLFLKPPTQWTLGQETYKQGDEGYYTKATLEGVGLTTAHVAHYTGNYAAGRSADIDNLGVSCALAADQMSSTEEVAITASSGLSGKVFSARYPVFDDTDEKPFDYLIGSISVVGEDRDCIAIVVQPNNSTNRARLVEMVKSARN